MIEDQGGSLMMIGEEEYPHLAVLKTGIETLGIGEFRKVRVGIRVENVIGRGSVIGKHEQQEKEVDETELLQMKGIGAGVDQEVEVGAETGLGLAQARGLGRRLVLGLGPDQGRGQDPGNDLENETEMKGMILELLAMPLSSLLIMATQITV